LKLELALVLLRNSDRITRGADHGLRARGAFGGGAAGLISFTGFSPFAQRE
jgi:hypothetical protein